jgi:hypothetical protein
LFFFVFAANGWRIGGRYDFHGPSRSGTTTNVL